MVLCNVQMNLSEILSEVYFYWDTYFYTYEIKPVIHNLIDYSDFVSKASPKYVIRMQISGETDMKLLRVIINICFT